MCTSNRDDRKLENTVKQSPFKHLGELHKEWTEAGVSASRVTTLRLRRKITGLLLSGPKLLFSDKSTFCFLFRNQGLRVWRKTGEAQNPSCLKYSVRFLKSEMIWGVVTCFTLSVLSEVFYFKCNKSKIYESFTFWNNLQETKKLFHHILIFWDAPVYKIMTHQFPLFYSIVYWFKQ